MFAVFQRASSQAWRGAKSQWTARCEESSSEGQSLDDLEKSLEAEEAEKDVIKGTMSYNDLKGSLNQCGANTFDGLRLIVQKQVNLNTVVSHFYWVGSQAMPQPLYQYRLILPFDEKSINVATNMDFTMMEGEANLSLTENIALNGSFGVSPNGNSISATCSITDAVSHTAFNYQQAEAELYTMSYVQAMTKALSLGGSGTYSDGVLRPSFGGLYSGEENVFGAVYGGVSSVHSSDGASLELPLFLNALSISLSSDYWRSVVNGRCYTLRAISIV